MSSGAVWWRAVGSQTEEDGGLIQIAVTCVGSSALLMNAMSEQRLLDIWHRKKKPKTASRRLPWDEAMSKLHGLADGAPPMPAKALYATFVNAGQGRGVKVLRSGLLSSRDFR